MTKIMVDLDIGQNRDPTALCAAEMDLEPRKTGR